MPHPFPGTGSSQFSLDHIPTTDAEVDAAAALMSLPTFGSNRHPNNGNKNKSLPSGTMQQHQQRGHSSSTAATSTTAATPRFAFADNGVAPPSSATHIRNVCYSSDSSLSDLSYGVEPPTRNRSRSPPSTLEGGGVGARSTGGGSSKSRGRKPRKKSPNRHKQQQQQPRFAFDDDQPRGGQQQMPNVRVTSYASDSSLSSYGDYDERVAHRRSNTRRQPSRSTNDGRAEYQESIEVELNPDSHQSYGNHHHHGNTSGAVAPAGGRNIVTPVATPASATFNHGVHEPRFELAGDSRQQYQQQQQGQYRNPTTYNSDSSISSYGRGDHGSAAGSVVSGAAAYINPANVSMPRHNNNNTNGNVNHYLATDAQMLANMKLDASYSSMPGAAVPAAPAAAATSPRFSFADDQRRQQQQQQQQYPTVTVSRPRSNSGCDSSISSHGDDSSAAYSYGENLVAQAASSAANNKALPSPGITCYPGSTSLALPGDDDILSPLHCFMRKYGVEAFSAEPDDVARPRYGKAHAARVVVGQVGIRCLHCKHRSVSERPERAVCYPSSLRNIYHSIETWQRKHSPVCTDMPRAMKERLDGLINGSRKSAGGRRQYWEESAKKVGMVDTPAGVRFAREPGFVETEVGGGGAPTFTLDGGGSSMSDLNMSQSSIPHTISIPLVSPETDDATLVSGFLFCLMSQMETCQFTEEDRSGNRSKVKDCPLGFPGMQCKHCRGVAGLGRYFPSSIDALALANSDRNICNHVMKCRKCPQETKDRLQRLQQEQASGKHKQKRGSRKKFFTTIWERIQHPCPHDGPSCTQPIGSSGIRALV